MANRLSALIHWLPQMVPRLNGLMVKEQQLASRTFPKTRCQALVADLLFTSCKLLLLTFVVGLHAT